MHVEEMFVTSEIKSTQQEHRSFMLSNSNIMLTHSA